MVTIRRQEIFIENILVTLKFFEESILVDVIILCNDRKHYHMSQWRLLRLKTQGVWILKMVNPSSSTSLVTLKMNQNSYYHWMILKANASSKHSTTHVCFDFK